MTSCSGPTPVGEAIRRCEELLDANRGRPRARGGGRRAASRLLLAMAGRFDEARECRATSSRRCSTRSTSTSPSLGLARGRRGRDGARRRPRRAPSASSEAKWLALRGRATRRPQRLRDRRRLRARRSLLRRGPLGRGRAVPRLPRPTRRRARRHAGRASARRRGTARGPPRPPRRSARARRAGGRGRRAHATLLNIGAPESGSRSPRCSGRPGSDAEADAAVATALALYEQKGNVAAARVRLRDGARCYVNCAFATLHEAGGVQADAGDVRAEGRERRRVVEDDDRPVVVDDLLRDAVVASARAFDARRLERRSRGRSRAAGSSSRCSSWRRRSRGTGRCSCRVGVAGT